MLQLGKTTQAGDNKLDCSPSRESATDSLPEIRQLWSFFRTNEIPFCLLSSASDAGCLTGGDIDIYFDGERKREVVSYLRINGWKAIPSYRFTRIRFGYRKIINGVNIKLDLSTQPLVFASKEVFRFHKQIAPVENAEGCLFLDSPTAALFSLMKARVKGEWSSVGNEPLRRSFCPNIFVNNDTLDAFLAQYFSSVSVRSWSLASLIRIYLCRLKREGSGLMVALIGVDGAGKSTLAEEVSQDLESRHFGVRNVYFGHSRFCLRIFEFLSRLRQHKSRPIRWIGILIYLLIFPFELLWRHRLVPADILICDRHPAFELVRDDIFGKMYAAFLTWLVGRPALTFFLDGEDESLWLRKKEMSFDEFIQQAEKLRRHLISNPRVYRIETTRERGECRDEMVRVILKVMQSDGRVEGIREIC